MKPFFALLAFAFVPAGLTQAEIAVYHGNQVVKTTSANPGYTQPERLIQIVDWDTAQIVQIRFGVKQFKKTFTVSEATPVVITEVGNSRGKKQNVTVLAQALTEIDLVTGDTVVTSLLQSGFNSTTGKPKEAEIAARPRLLKQTASRVDAIADPGSSQTSGALVEIKGTLHLRVADTDLSNQAGDDLSAAVARVVEKLISEGLTDVTVYDEVETVEP